MRVTVKNGAYIYIYYADVLAGGNILAYAAYEGEGTHESVGEAHTQRGELAHQ